MSVPSVKMFKYYNIISKMFQYFIFYRIKIINLLNMVILYRCSSVTEIKGNPIGIDFRKKRQKNVACYDKMNFTIIRMSLFQWTYFQKGLKKEHPLQGVRELTYKTLSGLMLFAADDPL